MLYAFDQKIKSVVNKKKIVQVHQCHNMYTKYMEVNRNEAFLVLCTYVPKECTYINTTFPNNK